MSNKIFAFAKTVDAAQSDDSELRKLSTTFEKDSNDILNGMG